MLRDSGSTQRSLWMSDLLTLSLKLRRAEPRTMATISPSCPKCQHLGQMSPVPGALPLWILLGCYYLSQLSPEGLFLQLYGLLAPWHPPSGLEVVTPWGTHDLDGWLEWMTWSIPTQCLPTSPKMHKKLFWWWRLKIWQMVPRPHISNLPTLFIGGFQVCSGAFLVTWSTCHQLCPSLQPSIQNIQRQIHKNHWPLTKGCLIHLWTTSCLNLTFVMANPWLAQRVSNKASLGSRSDSLFLTITPL